MTDRKSVPHSDALDALVRVNHYARAMMANEKPNSVYYEQARCDRDWAERVLRELR